LHGSDLDAVSELSARTWPAGCGGIVACIDADASPCMASRFHMQCTHRHRKLPGRSTWQIVALAQAQVLLFSHFPGEGARSKLCSTLASHHTPVLSGLTWMLLQLVRASVLSKDGKTLDESDHTKTYPLGWQISLRTPGTRQTANRARERQ
jgi:hypothetical protein